METLRTTLRIRSGYLKIAKTLALEEDKSLTATLNDLIGIGLRRTRAMTQREKIITKIDKLAQAALKLKISGTALHRLGLADHR